VERRPEAGGTAGWKPALHGRGSLCAGAAHRNVE